MLNQKTLLKNVRLIRSVVDKPTFTQLQLQLSERLFSENTLTGMVQPETLARKIATNESVLKAIYSPEQVKWLKDIAEISKSMASAELMAKNPSGTAQNVVTWGTFGAILYNPIQGLFTGVIAPKTMANIYLSEAGRNYFMLGMKTPIGTKRGTEIATKLMEIAGLQALNTEGEQPIEPEQ